MHRIVIALGIVVCAGLVSPATTASASPGSLTITASGTDVGVYPAFDPAIHRYAVTTSAATEGAVSMAISGTTGATVDGRPTQNTTVTGLSAGNEIGVRANGSSYSFVYLPAGFPTLKVTTDEGGLQSGYVALTLNKYAGDGSPTYDAIVDRQGVPVWVEEESAAGDLDLKRQADGSLTVMRPTGSGDQLVTLNDQYQPVGRPQTTVGLGNTDGHDSWVFPDGRKILIASVPDADTGKTDAVIQEKNGAGEVTFQWSTASLPDDESLFSLGGGDYAHINSVWPLPDGDIVASFRHFSAVLRIATTAHDGYQPGDIVWQLGGRHSSFTFPDSGFEGGPCAQHTASDWTDSEGREHVLVFDDGSNEFDGGGICVNPADPSGAAIFRPQTRATEYVLDPADHTASVAWNYQVTGVSTVFAGSAYRMANGNTLIGWAATPHAIASEVSPSEQLLWQLEDAGSGTPGYAQYETYRAMLVTAPDRIKPVVSATAPIDGKAYPAFTAPPSDYSCTDRGGSNLVGCSARPDGSGYAPGKHSMTFTATDGAGNVTTVVRRFTLIADYWPEASVTAQGHHAGVTVRGSWKKQVVRTKVGRRGRVKARITLVNGGSKADRLALAGNDGNRKFAVRYRVAGKNRTHAIGKGTFRTPTVAPGHKVVVTVVIRRLGPAHHGDRRNFHLVATSVNDSTRKDAAGIRVTAR